MKSPWPKNIPLRIMAFIWSIPLGILGMLASLVLILADKPLIVSVNEGALDIVLDGPIAHYFIKRGWGAFTLGWSIFFWGADIYTVAGKVHERTHVKQYRTYGIIFPFIYLWWLLRRGYRDNPFEIEARNRASEVGTGI